MGMVGVSSRETIMTKTRNLVQHDGNGNIVFERIQSWEVGNHSTPHEYHMLWYSGTGSSVALGSSPCGSPQASDQNSYNLSVSKAMAAFDAAKSDSATWANNALEAEATANSIGSACDKLMGFGKALDRGAPAPYLAKLLGISGSRSKWGKAKAAFKTFGDAWLSWHFGWSPMADDIGTAMNRINEPSGFSRKIRGRASAAFETHDIYHVGPDAFGISSLSSDHSHRVYHCNVQAVVTLDSPIIGSLNALGFVNPLSVAWEAVPYSFVVDWFSNVGQFLGQSTMMTGYTAVAREFCVYQVAERDAFSVTSGPHANTDFDYNGASSSCYVDRLPALPGVPLAFKPFKGFSASRGATAAALLAQFLSSK